MAGASPDRDALSLLECGEAEVQGPDAVELQRHLPGHDHRRCPDLPGGVQAGTGRAAAVGLPARALPPRAGRLPPVGVTRLGPRAAHRHPGRTARRGVVPALHRGRLRAALLHAPRGAARSARAAPDDVRVRHRRQQHRPQERPRAARSRRPDLGSGSGPVLLRRLQAAHRHLGVRRRARAGGPAPRHRTPGDDRPARPRGAARRRGGRRAAAPRAPRWCATRSSRSTPAAAATPGPSSSPRTRRASTRSAGRGAS